MVYLFFNSNTMGVTGGAGTANLSEAPELPPLFTGVCVAQSLVLCVVVLFITVYPSFLFLLAIILSEIMYYLKFQRKTKQTYDCPGFPL